MKNLVISLLLSCFAFAGDSPCVILKRASTGEHTWSGIEYQYVRGEYPKEAEKQCALDSPAPAKEDKK